MPRPTSPPPPPPPYGVAAVPAFGFRALAALAARSAIGGGREIALACLLGARLTTAARPPYRLTAEQRRARAGHAQAWLTTLALPAEARAAVARLFDGTAAPSPSPAALADALRQVVEAAGPLLDDPARAELAALGRALDGAPAATDDGRG